MAATSKNEEPRGRWFDGTAYRSCVAIWPFFRGAVWIGLIIFSYYLYQRDTVAAQGMSLADLKREQVSMKQEMLDRRLDRDKQMAGFEGKMLTREVFEAYHKADSDRMDRMENLIGQILQHEAGH